MLKIRVLYGLILFVVLFPVGLQADMKGSNDMFREAFSSISSALNQVVAKKKHTMAGTDATQCLLQVNSEPSCSGLVGCLQYSTSKDTCNAHANCAWLSVSGFNVCAMPLTTDGLYPMCKAGGCVSTISNSAACTNTTIVSMVPVLCVTDSDGTYCASKLSDMLTASQALANGSVSSNVLQTICSSCVRKLLAGSGTNLTGAFDLICTQSGGHYCLVNGYVGNRINGIVGADRNGNGGGVSMSGTGGLGGTGLNGSPNLGNLGGGTGLGGGVSLLSFGDFMNSTLVNSLCSDLCFFKLMANVLSVASSDDAQNRFSVFSKLFCAQGGPAGGSQQYCVTSALAMFANASSLNCTYLQSLQSQFGCCVGTNWQLVQAVATYIPGVFGTNLLSNANSVFASCPGANATCNSQQNVTPQTSSVKLQARWSVVSANLAAYAKSVKTDVASNLGIPLDYITNVVLAPQTSTVAVSQALQGYDFGRDRASKFETETTDSGTQATLTIQASSAAQTQGIVSELTSTAGLLTFPTTSAQYGTTISTGNGAAPVIAGTPTTLSTTTSTWGSSYVPASLPNGGVATSPTPAALIVLFTVWAAYLGIEFLLHSA